MVYTSKTRSRGIQRGASSGDVDRALLSLVASGCTVEEIVSTLSLSLREVHLRLVKLRLIIHDVSRGTATD